VCFWQDDRLWLYGWDGEDYLELTQSRLLAGLEIGRLEMAIRSDNLLEAVKLFNSL
jgi:hypothetical protein